MSSTQLIPLIVFAAIAFVVLVAGAFSRYQKQ
jgi:hypothetical protein